MKTSIAAAVVLVVSACAMPSTVARTRDTRPSVAVVGAPAGSTLFVDGLDMGAATVYDGNPAVLRLEPGTHEIVVHDASGNVVSTQKVFLESELKTIQVH